MKATTVVYSAIILLFLYFVLKHYATDYYDQLIKRFQYGVPRLPSPLQIVTPSQHEEQEHFSQTMQEELSTIGSYTPSKPYTPEQSAAFQSCIQQCDTKMNKCISVSLPSSCEYNYQICRQDCGWDAKINA